MDTIPSRFDNSLYTLYTSNSQLREHQILGRPCFCVKTKEINSNKKFFMNFCSSSEVKYPTLDWDEQKFTQIYQEESEEIENFRIPMALKTLSWTCDKKGEDKHYVIDILINDKYMEARITKSDLFKTFLVTVSIDTIENKHNGGQRNNARLNHRLDLEKTSWIVLKNKKYQEHSELVSFETKHNTMKDSKGPPKISASVDVAPSTSQAKVHARLDARSNKTKYPHCELIYSAGTNSLKGTVKCRGKHLVNPEIESLDMRINDDHIYITINQSGWPTKITLLDTYVPMLIDINASHDVEYDPCTDCLKFILRLCVSY